MPTGGVIVVCALGAITYLYGVRPIVHVVKKADHGICKVVTLGHKCKAQPKPAEVKK